MIYTMLFAWSPEWGRGMKLAETLLVGRRVRNLLGATMMCGVKAAGTSPGPTGSHFRKRRNGAAAYVLRRHARQVGCHC